MRENDRSCSDGEQGSVFDNAAFSVTQNLIVNESSCITWSIAEYIFQFAFLVAANVDYAMVHVNAWVYGFDRAVDSAVLHVAADDVVA